MVSSRSVLVLLSLGVVIQSGLALDNGLAKTPPMGWLAWERFTCEINCKEYPNDCINSNLFKSMADHLKHDGYLELGYQYVNIDDCWSELRRDELTERLVPDAERFPDGIRSLADYIHARGLKIGIYGDCGTKTCAGYPAQLKSESNHQDNYFDIDAKTFSEWQIDSFKFDGCNIDPFKAELICPSMAKSLASSKRDILLTCEWPFYMLSTNRSAQVDWKLVESSCNLWRYHDDVEDAWLSILSIVDFSIKLQSTIVKHHGPGAWFDPDMLIIGNFGLSLAQAQAQMAIWSLWSAPLFMSNDLRNIDPDMASVLQKKHLIGVNQDQLGVFGLMVAQKRNGLVQAFVKPIETVRNGCPSFAIVYFYRDNLGNRQDIAFPLRDLLTAAKEAIQVAADRYNQVYPTYKPGKHFDAASCIERLTKASTRDAGSIPANLVNGANSTPIEYTRVDYDVFDLIEEKPLSAVGLDSSLKLEVSPSGVRAVKLTEVISTQLP